MDLLPIFLDLQKKRCLVVGGGDVAVRKIGLLLRAGADVTVVSPAVVDEIIQWRNEGKLLTEERHFRDEDLADVHLVIAATDDPDVNARISELAHSRKLPVNVVDRPKLCSFIMPSIIDRSPVVAAVSTGGASPILARLIRTRLESMIPSGYGRLAELCNRYRKRVQEKFSNPTDRRLFWDDMLQGAVAERVFAGQMDEAAADIEKALDESQRTQKTGEVYLVGAGPGDPDLLTFRALRLMQQADVVVYDRLVGKPILNLTRQDAKRIYVGKERNNHTMRQEEINRLLASLAKEGKRVIRLKGGDPFIFGRGGEEIDTLAAEGIPFQVVPGVTAASGCAAYAGIPLTHRDYAQSVTFVTGHLKDGTMNLNWQQLAQPRQTVVFYMGLLGISLISENLKAQGVPGNMPVALVQQGTTPQQKVYTTTLSNIPEVVEREKPKAPTLIIVGEVVKLRDKLSWFESQEESATTSPPL